MPSQKSQEPAPPALPKSPPPQEYEVSQYISLHDTPPSSPAPEKPPRVFQEMSTTTITTTATLEVVNTPSPDSFLAPSETFQTPPESFTIPPDEPEKSPPPSDADQSADDNEIPTVTVVEAEGVEEVSGTEDVFQDAEDQSSVLLRAPSMRRRASSRASTTSATGRERSDSTLKRAMSAKMDRFGSAISRFLDREKSSDSGDNERPKSMVDPTVIRRNDQKKNDNKEKRNSLIPFGSDFIRRSFRQKSSDVEDDPTRDASPAPSEESSYRSSIYHEDLVSTLMCAACKHYMVGSIEQCKRGHNICKYCWRRAHHFRCPVCKARMSGIRNFLAEDMARKLLFPCVHAHAGCPRQVPNDELEYHQPRCPFRVYNCLINVESGVPCKWEGRRTYLEEHVRAQHSRYFSSQETTTWRWSPNLLVKMEDFQLISAFGELFWYCAAQDPERLRVCWFVQHVGYDQDSVRYEFSFLFSSEDKDRRLEMKCTTLPDYSTVTSIIESGHCLDMSYQQAFSFVDEEGTIKFSVTISKVD